MCTNRSILHSDLVTNSRCLYRNTAWLAGAVNAAVLFKCSFFATLLVLLLAD
jgi:hypothetical protein